ncbi:MAG: hypothetical protein ACRDFX_05800 [Chloroflexota bacterium]
MSLGALIGFLIGRGEGTSPWAGAALGALASGAATFVAVRIRFFLIGRGVPNPAAGLLEDCLVFGLLRASRSH